MGLFLGATNLIPATGGGTGPVVNNITTSSPYNSVGQVTASVYADSASPSHSAANEALGYYHTTTDSTAYTDLVNLTTADSANGGALLYCGIAQSFGTNKTSPGQDNINAATNGIRITIDGGTPFELVRSSPVYQIRESRFGGIRGAGHSLVFGGVPVSTDDMGSGVVLLNSVHSRRTVDPANNISSFASAGPTVNADSINIQAPPGEQWFGSGLPWLRWTTSLRIEYRNTPFSTAATFISFSESMTAYAQVYNFN